MNKHAPVRTKFLRANNRPHVTKELRLAIMKRSKLKHIANKSNNPDDMAGYRCQRNIVVNMNRKAYCDSVDENSSCEDFWKICQPLFSNKSNAINERIQLLEEGELISDNSIYFNRITDSLNIPAWSKRYIIK